MYMWPRDTDGFGIGGSEFKNLGPVVVYSIQLFATTNLRDTIQGLCDVYSNYPTQTGIDKNFMTFTHH